MRKSFFELMNEIVTRVNVSGCRVTAPFSEPSPIRVSFDGSFSNAEYIHFYPATLHIYGMPGTVSVSDMRSIEKISENDYLIRFGGEEKASDILIRIQDFQG